MLWDATHGWALALEIHDGADLIVVGYLGIDLVPPPRVVADYADATEHAGADPVGNHPST